MLSIILEQHILNLVFNHIYQFNVSVWATLCQDVYVEIREQPAKAYSFCYLVHRDQIQVVKLGYKLLLPADPSC